MNTGDDIVLHGLWISPDLDTVTYTLADAINPETGWGLRGETWDAMAALDRYGGQSWFSLGDRDLGTHLYRTQRMAEGATLSQVTAEVTEAWGVDVRVLPMSDQRVETRVVVAGGREVGFQEYFVAMRHDVPIESVRFAGIERAAPGPDVLDAIDNAGRVIVCPSNPIVSLAPVLSVPGVRERVTARRERVVAISPIVGGKALKGPADRMLRELGHEASVVAVAELLVDVAGTLVIDTVDADRAPDIERLGLRCVVADTVMHDVEAAAALARTVIAAA